MSKLGTTMAIGLLAWIFGLPASAQELAAEGDLAAESEPAPAPEAKPTPAPYSLPWQVTPGTGVRSDTVLAFYKPSGTTDGRSTLVTQLSGSYKVMPDLAVSLKLSFTRTVPGDFDPQTAFQNPLLGALYGMKPSPDLRLGLFFGLSLPFGSGGGDVDPTDTSQLEALAAQATGSAARSAMEGSMFAPNHLTPFPGVSLAYVKNRLTAQVDFTLFPLIRVKGTSTQSDGLLVNSTYGVHVGYFVIDMLSAGAELRYQRLLKARDGVDGGAAARDTLTVAVGPRVHLKLGETTWIRPGIAYIRGLDKPLTDANYNMFQLDVPVAF
jgi:hypothetical protein